MLNELYPGAREHVYLDVAAVGLVSTRVRDAVATVLDDHVARGIAAGADWTAASERTRGVIAELIGGRATNVAYTQNTSTGIALVANGLDWRHGDNVVVPADEFPSNFYPWLALRRHGVEIREVPMRAGRAELERLAELIDARTRVVAISAVQYTSGHRYDLARIRERCGDALLVVDGTQAAGALVIDADADGIDALVVSAHKWMLGPFGIGFVHFSDRAMERLNPSTTGWLSVEHPFDFDHEPRLASSARRFESGTFNAAGIAGLDAAISIVLELGRHTVENIVLGNAAHLQERLTARGLQVLRSTDPDECSGIVIFTTGDQAADAAIHAQLTESGIRCSLRKAGVRFSPHYYNTDDDLHEAVATIR
ncbi:aminotransferase class V-fold PLP-dependent enzyme [Solirubrobacter taibaiensis]|nr:aminotransferase class V-fold PLP-dependent enzyme [Solirubrobacter taibaiensis]